MNAAKQNIWVDQLLIVAVFSCVYFGFLGGSYLWDWDETVYAAAAKQMHERNDWVVPIVAERLDGTTFYGDKPILMYWGMLISFQLFGVNEFAARFPSAFFGMSSLLLVYHLVRRLMNRRIALLTAFSLGTMALYCVESRAVTPDATLMFWTTAATLCYIVGVFPARKEEEADLPEESVEPAFSEMPIPESFFPAAYPICLLLYFCLGMAFLDKGPVGVVLPMAVIGMFMLIKRLPKRNTTPSSFVSSLLQLLRPFYPLHFLKTIWAMRPFTAIAVIVLVASPWYLLVHQRTGGAWTEFFFGVHNFGRATAAMEGHGYPLDFLWHYPLSLLGITFPWSVLFLPALLDMIQRLRRGTPLADGYIFAACWVMVYLIVFSIVDTKMPNYIFLASTGAAIIYAAFLDHWAQHKELVGRYWFVAAAFVWSLVGIIAGIVLGILIRLLVPNGMVLHVIPIFLVLSGGILLSVSQWSSYRRIVPSLMSLFAVVLSILIFQYGAAVVAKQQDYKKMFIAVETECPHPVYRSFGQFEPSWIFYGNRPVIKIDTHELEAVRRFFAAHPGDGYLITAREKYEEFLQPAFGDSLRIVVTVPYFLKLEKVPQGQSDDHTVFGMRQRELLMLTIAPTIDRAGSAD